MNIFRNTDTVHLKNLIKGIFELSITMLSAQSSKCCLETVGVRMKIQLFVMGDFTTLYNVCGVPWGCSVPWGYHEYCGGISWVPWGISWVPWGVILSTVGDVQYRGGYHDACGGYHEYRGGWSVLWGENLLLFEYPTVLNTSTVLMISPT